MLPATNGGTAAGQHRNAEDGAAGEMTVVLPSDSHVRHRWQWSSVDHHNATVW
jgi:hypothetical protein